MVKKKVLIIDSDLKTCKEIKYALQSEETDVYYANNANAGMEQLIKHPYCLVIMDLLLSEANGMSLLKMIRQTNPIPVLVLTSAPKHDNKVSLLKAGVSSYMEKPFELEECLAQAQSLMQLCSTKAPDPNQRYYTLAFGLDLIINPLQRRVTLKGETIDLTRKEFDLLFCLASHVGQVLSREQLYSHVWPNDNVFDADASVKNHIKKLRKKLSPSGKEYIKNVWGIGYRFISDDETDE